MQEDKTVYDFIENLEEFEINREIYKTFEDYYPKIITYLQNEIKSKKSSAPNESRFLFLVRTPSLLVFSIKKILNISKYQR